LQAATYLQYVVLEQLDALAVQGVSRVLAGFTNIDAEAEQYAESMFDSYLEAVGEGNPAEFAEEARDQGVQYFILLSELRQSLINLLAVAIYHLFEQHRDQVFRLVREAGGTPPGLEGLDAWTKVDELRLVANTVKHAEGSSAEQLRTKRPDLFVAPLVRASPVEENVLRKRRENPLGGTDLFLAVSDLHSYCDGIRELWESVRPLV